MFYTVIPTVPPIFAVQPNTHELADAAAAELLRRLEHHFMLTVVLVSWDSAGTFISRGQEIEEHLVISEDLVWREFELQGEPEIPF